MLRFLFVATVLLVIACSPQRLIERGDYAKAFERSAKQLERRNDRPAEVSAVLAEAYAHLQASDQRSIELALAGGDRSAWERVVELYEALDARFLRVDAIRLSAKRPMRFPELHEPNYAQELVVAKREAAAYLLDEARRNLRLGREGHRPAARTAYQQLERRTRYAAHTAQTTRLQREARELGTVIVGIETYGNVNTQYLERLGLELDDRLGGFWVRTLALSVANEDQVDVIASLDVGSVRIEGPRFSKRLRTYTTQISQVKIVGRDSLGKAIKKTIKKEVRATVLTQERIIKSSLAANLTLVDVRTGDRLFSDRILGVFVDDQIGTTISGDLRALKRNHVSCYEQSMRREPTRSELRRGAVHALKNALPRVNVLALTSEQLLSST